MGQMGGGHSHITEYAGHIIHQRTWHTVFRGECWKMQQNLWYSSVFAVHKPRFSGAWQTLPVWNIDCKKRWMTHLHSLPLKKSEVIKSSEGRQRRPAGGRTDIFNKNSAGPSPGGGHFYGGWGHRAIASTIQWHSPCFLTDSPLAWPPIQRASLIA